jgi:hypothetical protein
MIPGLHEDGHVLCEAREVFLEIPLHVWRGMGCLGEITRNEARAASPIDQRFNGVCDAVVYVKKPFIHAGLRVDDNPAGDGELVVHLQVRHVPYPIVSVKDLSPFGFLSGREGMRSVQQSLDLFPD